MVIEAYQAEADQSSGTGVADCGYAVGTAAGRNGHTAVQLALGWTVHQPGITSWEQMAHCLSALSVEMSDDERQACDHSAGEETT